LPWFARFAPVVEARDQNGFYGPMTRFLHGAIREVTRESPSHQS
jgi:TorA maturation chaperone TorD